MIVSCTKKKKMGKMEKQMYSFQLLFFYVVHISFWSFLNCSEKKKVNSTKFLVKTFIVRLSFTRFNIIHFDKENYWKGGVNCIRCQRCIHKNYIQSIFTFNLSLFKLSTSLFRFFFCFYFMLCRCNIIRGLT